MHEQEDILPVTPEERKGRRRVWTFFIVGLIAIAVLVLLARSHTQPAPGAPARPVHTR